MTTQKRLFDLISPDGVLRKIERYESHAKCHITFEGIANNFVGFGCDPALTFFNLKSTLAQLGVDSRQIKLTLSPRQGRAEVECELYPYGHLAQKLIWLLQPGAHLGKLFTADPNRVVRNADYLNRTFERYDRWGRPLLHLGGTTDNRNLVLGKADGRLIAYLPLKRGVVKYRKDIEGLLPTVAIALNRPHLHVRELLALHQDLLPDASRTTTPGEILLVKTQPLHLRTVFAVVADKYLPPGVQHTNARVLDPTTADSGDIYELYGDDRVTVNEIPLEFYTLEPYREHVFFEDRDQLQAAIEDPAALVNAFKTAPGDNDVRAAVFVVKGSQLRNLQPSDWLVSMPQKLHFPGVELGEEQSRQVKRWIAQQPATAFLEDMERGMISSEGILLMRHLPSPYLKRLLCSDLVQPLIKGIYFQIPSQAYGNFFSADDRALLSDLVKYGIAIYWLDSAGGLLRYVPRPKKDSGMFVPLNRVKEFQRSSFFGLYGSNLIEGSLETELRQLMEGVMQLRPQSQHPLLNQATEIAMVTGGGPGVMEVGNRVAVSLGILSCANVLDFGRNRVVNEQRTNPFIEAKMTYRLDKLVERQAEFELDFPIFLMGGIGTDFELFLEQVRRKTGASPPTPVLLFGSLEYWSAKLSHIWELNRQSGTIKDSEWVSNCFFQVENAHEALFVYSRFFAGTLPIGIKGPTYYRGFCNTSNELIKN